MDICSLQTEDMEQLLHELGHLSGQIDHHWALHDYRMPWNGKSKLLKQTWIDEHRDLCHITRQTYLLAHAMRIWVSWKVSQLEAEEA